MFKAFCLFALALIVTSCDPDIKGTCDLTKYEGKDFVGRVLSCNADPVQSRHFTAESHVTVLDSFLVISITNIDPLFPFSFRDTFKTECIIVEDYIMHNIRDYYTNSKVGELGYEGNNLNFSFKFPPCPESTSFNGHIE